MNIYDYIDEFGVYSFEEQEINEVDSAIFAFLSYANFNNIFDFPKMTINEIGRKHLGIHSKQEVNVIAVRDGNNLLKYIKDTKRYKNCIVSNYKYEGNDDVQFGVIAIEYKKNEVYISFEGTNELLSGWKENFHLTYEFPTKSHQMAINYLNRNFTFSYKKLIIGGHSKGGNLALVAAMNANYFVKNRIMKIYNFDGPGLLENELNSKNFKSILHKYIQIIPDYSVVGLLLENENTIVVKANNKTAFSHNIYYWQVDKTQFVRSKLSVSSKALKKDIDAWMNKYSEQEKIAFIDNLENICQKTQVKSLLEFKSKKTKILDFIYESKELSENSKKILMDFIIIFLKSLNNITKEEIKQFINKKIKLPKILKKEKLD